MESIGQILKAARERKGLTVAEVALAIKAKQSFVTAIESDNFDDVIAPVYAKGFIKLYAEHVGLNSQPLLRAYQINLENPVAQTKSAPAPQFARENMPATPVSPVTPSGNAWRAPASAAPSAVKNPPLPRVRQLLGSSFVLLSSRMKGIYRRDWIGFLKTHIRHVAGWLRRRCDTISLSRLRAAFKPLKVRWASGLAAIVILAGLLGMFAWQVRIEHYLRYAPSDQTGWLRPPPEPYP